MAKSLHNIDYKILTKSIAKRLENVLPKIIDLDQIGYVKNRCIGENVRLISNVLASTEETDIPYPGPRGLLLILSFLIWKFVTQSADRSAEPREKKASGQDRRESHFYAGSALDSSQRCHFLLTNHFPKDI